MLKFVTLSFLLGSVWLYAQAPIQHPYYQKKLYEFQQMKKNDLIFLGDSLTDYHNWRHFGLHHNAGIAGDTTDGLLYRLHYTLTKKPHTIVLMIGINDLLQGVALTQIKQNYSKVLDALSEIDQLIILSTLPVIADAQTEQINDNVIALNVFLKIEAKKRQMDYVDLYIHFANNNDGLQERYTVDGVHLNDDGYLLWEDGLKKLLNPTVPSQK